MGQLVCWLNSELNWTHFAFVYWIALLTRWSYLVLHPCDSTKSDPQLPEGDGWTTFRWILGRWQHRFAFRSDPHEVLFDLYNPFRITGLPTFIISYKRSDPRWRVSLRLQARARRLTRISRTKLRLERERSFESTYQRYLSVRVTRRIRCVHKNRTATAEQTSSMNLDRWMSRTEGAGLIYYNLGCALLE